ncbi:MAG: hypothetical protein ACON4N_10110 [Myxococcota bacterium]
MTRIFMAIGVMLGSCGTPALEVEPDPTCDGFYGQPNENTGLDSETCGPVVEGEALTWTPRSWDEAALTDLRSRQLVNPPEVPNDDPYVATPDLVPDSESVCAVTLLEDETYRLETFSDAVTAHEAGAIVTHGGACGLCSSLEDLAAYAGTPDLTQPVRSCGLRGLGGDIDGVDTCIQELGFTPACARIWAYNVNATRESCQSICISLLADPYHLPDGSLNACLQCDEDNSGPVFKSVAGRTRRNSGLATALCRPCETVWRLDHVYAL